MTQIDADQEISTLHDPKLEKDDKSQNISLADSLTKAKLDPERKKIKIRIKFKGYSINRQITGFSMLFGLILTFFSLASLIFTFFLAKRLPVDKFAPSWGYLSGILGLFCGPLSIFLARIVEMKGAFASSLAFLLLSIINWNAAGQVSRGNDGWIFVFFAVLPSILMFFISFVIGTKGFVMLAGCIVPVTVHREKEREKQ